MPWFPEFASGLELARSLTRAAGQADPVSQYVAALNEGDTDVLETAWPGEVVVYDPRYGEIRGHKRLRQFVRNSQSWLAERHARVETVSCTAAGNRAVVDCVRCGNRDLPPQAGIGVYERGPDGLLAAARTYDDVEPPESRGSP
jgi:SnoaL-like domain